jgi:voltage-gated sodium channel
MSKTFITNHNDAKDHHLVTISETSYTQLVDQNNNNVSISIMTNSNDTTHTNHHNQHHPWNDSIDTLGSSSQQVQSNVTNHPNINAKINSITNHNYQSNNNDDTESISSHISFGSTTDGIDVLRGNSNIGPPTNFIDWSHLIAARIVTSVIFKRIILFCILLSTILLAIRTIDTIRTSSHMIHMINILLQSLLLLFTIEILLTVLCFNELVVKSTGWLISDVITMCIVWYTNDVTFLILRSFRLIRALRKASGVPALQWAVRAILHVLPRLTAVILVLIPSMLAIFSILFTNLYQDADTYLSHTNTDDATGQQQYETASKSFRRLDVSALTLFQIMTGGLSWAEICTALMSNNVFPMAWLPLVGFVIISMFFAMTLVIALMCDAVSMIQRDKIWKSFEHPSGDIRHAKNPRTNTNKNCEVSLSPTAVTEFIDSAESQSNHPAYHQQQQYYQRLEQKLNELTNTVEVLLRVQIGIQESIESLMVQQLQLQERYSSRVTTTSPSQASSRQQQYHQQQSQLSLRNMTNVSSTSYSTAMAIPHIRSVPSDEH